MLCGILWPIIVGLVHTLAAILLTACVLWFAIGSYYGYAITRELESRVPDSKWNGLRAWFASPFLHRKVCSESQTFTKWIVCMAGMLVFGFLGFFFWMKQ